MAEMRFPKFLSYTMPEGGMYEAPDAVTTCAKEIATALRASR